MNPQPSNGKQFKSATEDEHVWRWLLAEAGDGEKWKGEARGKKVRGSREGKETVSGRNRSAGRKKGEEKNYPLS